MGIHLPHALVGKRNAEIDVICVKKLVITLKRGLMQSPGFSSVREPLHKHRDLNQLLLFLKGGRVLLVLFVTVATVVSDNINSYWDHLKQAKEALENDIITQEDYDDLKAHFLKKLKEM